MKQQLNLVCLSSNQWNMMHFKKSSVWGRRLHLLYLQLCKKTFAFISPVNFHNDANNLWIILFSYTLPSVHLFSHGAVYTNGSTLPSSRASNDSRASTTADIWGRDLGLTFKHLWAIAAAFWAARVGYCPSSLRSIMRASRRGSFRQGRAHSTRFCSRSGLFLSTAFRPVSSSSSTTPKLYTSLFVVKCPNYRE